MVAGNRLLRILLLLSLTVLAVPVSLLLLPGPALAVWRIVHPTALDGVPVVFVTLLGILVGGSALFYLVHTMPRSVVFDWPQGMVTIRVSASE